MARATRAELAARHERAARLRDWMNDQTPENWAAYQRAHEAWLASGDTLPTMTKQRDSRGNRQYRWRRA